MSEALVPDHLLLAIDHVGIAVPDLDDALEFYANTFGLRSVHEEVNEEQGVREAMLAVGDSGSCIQLLAPLSDESTIAKFLARNGQGIQQLADRVADIETRRAPALRRPQERDGRQPRQLRPPQGRRRRTRRARGTWLRSLIHYTAMR
jgi:methylmalonyl-CoA epimerase